MLRARRHLAPALAVTAIASLAIAAHADEPPPQSGKATAPTTPVATGAPAKPALQVASAPEAAHEAPMPERARSSDGAGPRLTFGRTFTEYLREGYYGRFETEYFVVDDEVITGALLGLEGWGTEDAKAGGGAIPISVFAGLRGGPWSGSKAPRFFATVGLGIDLVVYDRIGNDDGFGLLSPFAVGTAGMEIVQGVRLLADSRASYRWHWTSTSHAQFQVGLTLGLNSYLWDGP